MRDHAPAVAWVESPLQLASAVEAFGEGRLGPRAAVVPRRSARGMGPTLKIIAGLDLPAGLTLEQPTDTVPRPRSGGTWVVGDAFSGRFQSSLVRTVRPRRIVLVDDGLATIHLARQLVAPSGPFDRARARPRPSRRLLGGATAARLRHAAAKRDLELVTALDLPDDLAGGLRALGATINRHSFKWLSERAQAELPAGSQVVIIGSSLASDGLIDAHAYLRWIAEVSDGAPSVYFPHRREDAFALTLIGDIAGVTVMPPGLPVEVRLGMLGPSHRVECLPSTPYMLLPMMLAGSGATLHATRIPDAWWTSQATPVLRRNLNATVAAGS